jgi:hypothetical protein
MWAIFKLNVLTAMLTGQFKADPDTFAEFYANEYDKAIKSGGDLLYGVNVINGNVKGMADAIKIALKKGTDSVGSNFNVLAEIYPSAFDAYWSGAEMSPLPNPLVKPLGWPSTPPAPGAIQNIGPDPITLASTTAAHKAEVEALKILEDELKKQKITLPSVPPLPPIAIPVYETAQKIINKEEVAADIKNNPIVKGAVEIIKKLKEAKKKKAAIGKQIKKSLKIEFPKLPDRKKIIEENKEKLLEKAIEEVKKQIIPPIEDIILQPIYQYVQVVVALLDSIPKPKPTLTEIKKFVKDTANGLVPDIDIPIDIPNIPTKEELKKQVDAKTPTEEEIRTLAEDKIKGLIPDPPFISFTPPSFVFSTKTNVLLDPFLSLAQLHLLNVGGNMAVTAQYTPPAPPAPAIINYNGYQVKMGPPVPDFPSTVEFPQVDLGSIELPQFPELPQLPNISVTDLASLLTISLPNIEIKIPEVNTDIKTPTIPNVG